jgi:hypothetical protein
VFFVLGTQNLANVAHGEKLSSVFDGWKKEDLALLVAQLLLNAYDEFTETFGSHPKISYCRLNGKFSAFGQLISLVSDPNWLKQQEGEKAKKKVNNFY